MKYIITFIWAIVISQVTFYLGAQLTGMTYNAIHALLLAIFASVTVFIIVSMLPPLNNVKDDHSCH